MSSVCWYNDLGHKHNRIYLTHWFRSCLKMIFWFLNDSSHVALTSPPWAASPPVGWPYKRLKPWFFSKHHQCNRIFWIVRWRPVPYFLDTGFSTFLSGQVSISLDPEHCLDFSGYVRFPSLTRLLTSDISIAIQLHAHITATKQWSAAANRAHRQIWGPNINNNIIKWPMPLGARPRSIKDVNKIL